MKYAVDASAVLAVLKQEAGAAEASSKMRGGLISAVNVSEVYYKAAEFGKRSIAEAIIHTAELSIEPFDHLQAKLAAELVEQTKGIGISFADRACISLSLGEKLPLLTGDHRWGDLSIPIQFEFFRSRVN